MRTNFKKSLFLIGALILAMVFAFAACAPEEEVTPKPTEKTLTEIQITTPPTTLEYEVGQFFDRMGMVVTAYYDDTSTAIVNDYTVDKTNPLTLADTVVTVSYKGKTATLTIIVNEPTVYDPLESAPTNLTVTEDGIYRIEAETIDTISWGVMNGMVEQLAGASGGFSVGGVSSVGDKFGFVVVNGTEEEMTFDLTLRIASCFQYETEYDVLTPSYWNGEPLTTGAKVVAATEALYNNNWDSFTVSGLVLKPGRNVFHAVVTIGFYNYDYFELKVGEVEPPAIDPDLYDAILEGEGTYRVEAENLKDLSHLTPVNEWVSSFVERPSNASGGGSLGCFTTGDYVEISFYLTEASFVTLKLALAFSQYGPLDVDSYHEFFMDGDKLTTGASLAGYNDTNTYWNFEAITVFSGNLEEGEHVFKLHWSGTTTNFDYAEFVVGEAAFDPNRYDVVVNGEGTYKVEAENLKDLSHVTPINDSAVERPSNASGGASLGGFQLGSYVEITFWLEEAADVTLKLALAFSQYGPLDVDSYHEFFMDGSKLTTGASLAGYNETNQYWNFEEITAFSGRLEAGAHTFKLSWSGTTTNFDYVQFLVGGQAE